jgi:uncharacterized membrane protein YhaH (DUF805 family)
MEGQYSSRELDHYFKDIRSTLEEIKDQTVKTNGRVNRLENWRWLLTGGMTIITALVIPLIVYIWNTSSSHAIQNGISEALSAYEIKTVE